MIIDELIRLNFAVSRDPVTPRMTNFLNYLDSCYVSRWLSDACTAGCLWWCWLHHCSHAMHRGFLTVKRTTGHHKHRLQAVTTPAGYLRIDAIFTCRAKVRNCANETSIRSYKPWKLFMHGSLKGHACTGRLHPGHRSHLAHVPIWPDLEGSECQIMLRGSRYILCIIPCTTMLNTILRPIWPELAIDQYTKWVDC